MAGLAAAAAAFAVLLDLWRRGEHQLMRRLGVSDSMLWATAFVGPLAIEVGIGAIT